MSSDERGTEHVRLGWLLGGALGLGLTVGILGTYLLMRSPTSAAQINGATLVAPEILELEVATCDAEGFDVELSETALEVVVRVTARGRDLNEDSCQDTTLVRLPGALDGRNVIDASTDSAVPVR